MLCTTYNFKIHRTYCENYANSGKCVVLDLCSIKAINFGLNYSENVVVTM